MSASQHPIDTPNASKAFKDFYHYFFEDLYPAVKFTPIVIVKDKTK